MFTYCQLVRAVHHNCGHPNNNTCITEESSVDVFDISNKEFFETLTPAVSLLMHLM